MQKYVYDIQIVANNDKENYAPHSEEYACDWAAILSYREAWYIGFGMTPALAADRVETIWASFITNHRTDPIAVAYVQDVIEMQRQNRESHEAERTKRELDANARAESIAKRIRRI